MTVNKDKTCRACGAVIEPLTEFPGCICLDCHAAKWDSMDKREQWDQMMSAFGGGALK